jgi:hypothetical protein
LLGVLDGLCWVQAPRQALGSSPGEREDCGAPGPRCVGRVAPGSCDAMRCDAIALKTAKEEGRGANIEPDKNSKMTTIRPMCMGRTYTLVVALPQQTPSASVRSSGRSASHPYNTPCHLTPSIAIGPRRTTSSGRAGAARREIQRAGASGEICPAALTAPRLLGLWERGRGVAGVGGRRLPFDCWGWSRGRWGCLLIY